MNSESPGSIGIPRRPTRTWASGRKSFSPRAARLLCGMRLSKPRLDLPATDKAHLTVRAELQNASNAPVKGTLHGKILGAAAPIEFSQDVELKAGERRAIVITPESAPSLNVQNPRLWWPYQMGEPYLHKLTLEFVPDKGACI